MSRNTALQTAVIDVVPNLSNFISEMKKQLNGAGFESAGKAIGEDLSRGIGSGLDFQSAVQGWDNLVETIDRLNQGFAEIENTAKSAFRPIIELAATLTAMGVLLKGKLLPTLGQIFMAFGISAKAGFAVLGAALGPVGKTILAIAAVAGVAKLAWKLWGDQIQAVFARVKEFFAPIIDMFRDSLGRAFEQMQPHLESLRNALGGLWDMFKVIGAVIVAKFAPKIAKITVVFGILVGIVNGVINALAGIVQVVTGIVEVISGFFSLIVGIFTGDGEKISEAWETMWSGIQNIIFGRINMILGFVEGFIEGVATFFTNLWNTLVGNSIVPKMVNAIHEWFLKLVNFVTAPLRAMVAGATAIFNGLRDFAVNTFNNIREGISTAISSAVEFVSGAISRMRAAAGTLMTGLFNGIREGATNAVNRIREMVLDFVNTIRGFVENMRSAATALINGLLRGISEGASRIIERLRNLAGDAINAFKSRLGINSPSREFMKIGESICSGLIDGLNDGLADVIKAAYDMSDAVADAFDVAPTVQLGLAASTAGVVGTSYSARASRSALALAGASGNTYNTFNTPVTGYHEVLAAQRTAQRQAARR